MKARSSPDENAMQAIMNADATPYAHAGTGCASSQLSRFDSRSSEWPASSDRIGGMVNSISRLPANVLASAEAKPSIAPQICRERPNDPDRKNTHVKQMAANVSATPT